MSKIIIISTPRGRTFLSPDGTQTVSITRDHQNFDAAGLFGPDSDFAEIYELCSEPMRRVITIAKQYANTLFEFGSDGKTMTLNIHNQQVKVPKEIATAILQLHEVNGDIEPLVRFLENLLQNPNQTIYHDLFAWMQSGNLTLTSDGHFLAYKKVRENYLDIYTNSIDNSVGATPTMLRSTIDRDRDNTCAAGLHWCSWDYLQYYGGCDGYRIMIVKVNPADVDRIPTDYNRNKGVSWRYTVVGEIEYERQLDGVLHSQEYDEDEEDDFDEEFDDF